MRVLVLVLARVLVIVLVLVWWRIGGRAVAEAPGTGRGAVSRAAGKIDKLSAPDLRKFIVERVPHLSRAVAHVRIGVHLHHHLHAVHCCRPHHGVRDINAAALRCAGGDERAE